MQRYRERYPETWDKLRPNRFTTLLFLSKYSEIYRSVSGTDLTSENIDLELLGPSEKKK